MQSLPAFSFFALSTDDENEVLDQSSEATQSQGPSENGNDEAIFTDEEEYNDVVESDFKFLRICRFFFRIFLVFFQNVFFFEDLKFCVVFQTEWKFLKFQPKQLFCKLFAFGREIFQLKFITKN